LFRSPGIDGLALNEILGKGSSKIVAKDRQQTDNDQY